jgi:uncharacterized membrane protein
VAGLGFALALPWWALVLLAAAVAAVAAISYARVVVALTRPRRAVLITLRAATLALIVACLLRPVRILPPDPEETVVPVLVDVSRSMQLADAGGQTRIDAARTLIERELRPAFAGRFRPEIWTFGDQLTLASGELPAASAGRSDLSGALRAIRSRHRERSFAGVVVISDGGDTGSQDASAAVDDGVVPVFTIGVGMPQVVPDLEVLDVSAGTAALADSSVDLTVTAVARGSQAPFDLRVLANGRPVDVRKVTPSGPGSPVHAVFTVTPARDTATRYTAEIPSAKGEAVLENNRRSVLVEPPGRRRRLLIIEGAPGFEHSFIKRAIAVDPGIEVDSVVRKGRDLRGDPTYFVQAPTRRASRLTSGFPSTRQALYEYDALVLANTDPDALSRAQLAMAADFVGERGGGLLVFGARTFLQQGLVGTALEEVMPVSLVDRGSGVMRAVVTEGLRFGVSLAAEGQTHPVMRVGATPEDTARQWGAVPALAGASELGPPRPGASVLALVRAPDGPRPLVVVQRYGQGRAMVFTGEASWRWRMSMASETRTFEFFWRQSARWLSSAAPERVSIAPITGLIPGDVGPIGVDIRDDAFQPVRDGQVSLRVALPGGDTREVQATATASRAGRYSADFRFEQPGAYRISAVARRGDALIGSAAGWALVGAADLEMSDPRLHEDVLRRVSQASGGRYLSSGDLSELPSLLTASGAGRGTPRVEEAWQNIWMFVLIIGLLASEWVLRRRWGLR